METKRSEVEDFCIFATDSSIHLLQKHQILVSEYDANGKFVDLDLLELIFHETESFFSCQKSAFFCGFVVVLFLFFLMIESVVVSVCC